MAAILCRSKDDAAAANPATLLLTFALDSYGKESVCGGTDREPDRLTPLPRQRRLASAGFAQWRRDVAPSRLRGVWHV
jgi:hypothetical protein